jgi:hypothetical protein
MLLEAVDLNIIFLILEGSWAKNYIQGRIKGIIRKFICTHYSSYLSGGSTFIIRRRQGLIKSHCPRPRRWIKELSQKFYYSNTSLLFRIKVIWSGSRAMFATMQPPETITINVKIGHAFSIWDRRFGVGIGSVYSVYTMDTCIVVIRLRQCLIPWEQFRMAISFFYDSAYVLYNGCICDKILRGSNVKVWHFKISINITVLELKSYDFDQSDDQKQVDRGS